MHQIEAETTPRFALSALPILATIILAALAMGVALGLHSLSDALLTGGLLAVAIVIALRHDTLTAALIVALSLLEDWYRILELPFAFPVTSLTVALVLLGIIFLGQSEDHPWISVPYMWLWALFVVVASLHLLQGVSLNESIKYDAQVFANAAVMWTLGIQLVRNVSLLRNLLILLAAFGAVIAIHSILISLTGVFLFATPDALAHLASTQGFQITGTGANRAGSFIGSPDWNGTFMAMLAFLPLGLIGSATSRWQRLISGGEFVLLLLALLVTYSTAAWLAMAVGAVIFILLAARGRGRIYLLLGAISTPLAMAAIFPRETAVLIKHVTASGQLSLRLGAWETGLNVIRAHPLTGIGLGWTTYLERAAPYRVKAQIIPLAHPHNSYLELAAMGGLPVFLIFAVLCFLVGKRVWRTYQLVEQRHRMLFAGAIASLVALTVNSVAINGWTLQPLAAIGWLLAGALSSPALIEALRRRPDASGIATPAVQVESTHALQGGNRT